MTDKTIRQGFEHLKNAKEYDNLYHAAICRAEADWLVGLNATRALTCKYNAQLSCWSCADPDPCNDCKAGRRNSKFVPKPYYGLQLQAEGVVFTWKDERRWQLSQLSEGTDSEYSETIVRKEIADHKSRYKGEKAGRTTII